MLVKKISFRVNSVEKNEDGINVQKGIQSILDEYKKNHYFSELYKGYSDIDIQNKEAYVTEYEEQEFRGYLEECIYEQKKNYKVYIKDYKGECFHIGYVPLSRVPEIEEWLNNNSELELKGNIYILGGKVKYYDKNNGEITNEAKEYEFEVDLRFYKQEKLQEETKSNKKVKLNINKKYAIILISIIILLIIILGTYNLFKKQKFEITNFSIEKETTDYEYIDNYTTYKGEGLITTQNKKDMYIVVIKKTRKAGGNEDGEKEEYSTVLINEGKGKFDTYDSSKKEITKPEYDFEIIGYIKFKK